MRVLIVEDETAAYDNLVSILASIDPMIEIVGNTEGVGQTIRWLESHPKPDLIFMDIHLSDGSAFAIFTQTEVEVPIIFTTAYDEYAIDAFKVNSIDYLLKPVSKEALERAMHKLLTLSETRVNSDQVEKLLAQLGEKKKFRNYFLLPERDKLVPLSVSNVAYAYIEAKTVKMVTYDNKSYYLTQTLDDLIAQLDPHEFFRANRQFVVARKAIKDVSVWFGNKLAINLIMETPERIIVSKARVGEFKFWFTKQ